MIKQVSTKFNGREIDTNVAEYNIEISNNKYIRHVKPYVQVHNTFAKGRWIGRELLEVLTREFGGHPLTYWQNAILKGHVQVNRQIVPSNYKFKNSDSFLHRVHRHEPPVFGRVTFVGQTDDYLAVCKPPSLPMHACGAYRFNSLENILRYEPLTIDQPPLHLVHRLDRVTSGLVVLAKSKAAASAISTEIRDKHTKKVYLARVKGRFPADLLHMKVLDVIDFERLGADGDGDDGAQQNERRVDNCSGEKRKACEVEIGGDGQGDAGVEVTASLETTSVHTKARVSYQIKKARAIAAAAKKSGPDYGRGEDIRVEDLPERTRVPSTREQVGQADGVGYKYIDEENLSVVGGERCPVLWLQCPIGVLSHRDGIHACDPEGKASLSGFRLLGYCVDSDTSLVECRPFSGRTHQLRLHLQFLGNPIANDPCYGGQLFYGDADRRELALHALREMRRTGAHPLSKVPHFSDPELDSYILHVAENATALAAEVLPVGDLIENEESLQRSDETEDDYIVRTCRYCKEAGSSANLECFLHCDGIWLHALRYTGREWSFEAPRPEWALCFEEKETQSFGGPVMSTV